MQPMPEKPSIPKGTRDFSPLEMVRRTLIFETITQVFKRYGYLPIETPAMENLASLMGKYGEEGDRLLFKILNSGNFLEGADEALLASRDTGRLAQQISEKGLRYDLTVPFARYVVMHRNDILFPFKRYQIQPVWRADKPQKGRYREFYQCDVDVIGSNSMLNETELIRIIDEVFDRLGIPVVIRINNRKILSGMTEVIGQSHRFSEITTAIDKIDKNGIDKVLEEMLERGIPRESIDRLLPFLRIAEDNRSTMDFLKTHLSRSPIGQEGIVETEELLYFLNNCDLVAPVRPDLSLARGLNYYTGTIIEVVAREMTMGSLCGGGRYDDLTGIFGLPGISGVGVSFGADRIYDVMAELNLFPVDTIISTQVLLVNFGQKEAAYCLKLADSLRQAGICTELYPEPAKLKKQLSYADKKGIPYVLLIGETEMASGRISVKEMKTGEQGDATLEELIHRIERR